MPRLRQDMSKCPNRDKGIRSICSAQFFQRGGETMYSMSSLSKRVVFNMVILFCGTLPFFIGCAGPAQPINMIPDSYEVENRHNNSVKLSIEGGKRTSMIDKSQISNEDFMNALEESIRKSGVFTKIVKDGEYEYLLEVFLLALDQPSAGFNMEVKLSTNWTLTELKSKKQIWQKFIVTNHTATFGDSPAGISRLRMANEGAAKKNIQKGISELSRLNIKECC